jgi:hypothetical protein
MGRCTRPARQLYPSWPAPGTGHDRWVAVHTPAPRPSHPARQPQGCRVAWDRCAHSASNTATAPGQPNRARHQPPPTGVARGSDHRRSRVEDLPGRRSSAPNRHHPPRPGNPAALGVHGVVAHIPQATPPPPPRRSNEARQQPPSVARGSDHRRSRVDPSRPGDRAPRAATPHLARQTRRSRGAWVRCTHSTFPIARPRRHAGRSHRLAPPSTRPEPTFHRAASPSDPHPSPRGAWDCCAHSAFSSARTRRHAGPSHRLAPPSTRPRRYSIAPQVTRPAHQSSGCMGSLRASHFLHGSPSRHGGCAVRLAPPLTRVAPPSSRRLTIRPAHQSSGCMGSLRAFREQRCRRRPASRMERGTNRGPPRHEEAAHGTSPALGIGSLSDARWPPGRHVRAARLSDRVADRHRSILQSRRTSVGTGPAAWILGVHGIVARSRTAAAGASRERTEPVRQKPGLRQRRRRREGRA